VSGTPADTALPVEALSSPVDDDRSLEAARRIVGMPGPERDAALAALYPAALRHKTLRLAIRHLRRAGGDPAVLTIPADLFRSTWPLSGLVPAPEEHANRISLAELERALDEQRDRVRAVLRDLLAATAPAGSDAPPPGVMVVFGRSFEASYPGLRDRLDFDADLLAADLRTGLRLVRSLVQDLGFTLYRCRVSALVPGAHWMGLFNTFRSADGFETHVDVLVGGQPAGPGLVPGWFRPPLFDRSREVTWRGLTVRVPSAEDMLLMTAARLERKADFTRRDHNDAWFLLTEEARLDWRYVATTASSNGLTGPLRRLVEDAERRAGRTLAPISSRAVTRHPPRARTALRVARARFQARTFQLSVDLARRGGVAGLALPALRALRPGFGSLCELRAAAADAGPGFCLSRLPGGPRPMPGRLGPDERADLEAVIALLPGRLDRALARIRPDAPGTSTQGHRCRAFLYEVRRAPT
jgi:hypothetical protein